MRSTPLLPIRAALFRKFADTTPTGGGSGGTDPAGNPGDGDKGKGEQPPATPNVWTQERENAIRAEERRNAEKRFNDKLKQDADEAERKRLADEQQYKELSERLQNESKAKDAELKSLREYVSASIDREIATWPEKAKAKIPNADAPLSDRLAALDLVRDLVADLAPSKGEGEGKEGKQGGDPGKQGAKTPPDGANRSDPPSGGRGDDRADWEEKRRTANSLFGGL